MFQIYLDGKKMHVPDMDKRRKILDATLNQELNKAGSFNFLIPQEHYHYNGIHNLKSMIEVYDDDSRVFKGRVLNHNFNYYNVKNVIAEGEMAYFNDSVFQPSAKGTVTTTHLFPQIINNHNSQLEEEKHFKVGDIDSCTFEISSLSFYKSMDFIQNEIIKKTKGYISLRYIGDDRYIDFKMTPGMNDTSSKIQFGVNLLDLNRYIDPTELYTVIIPYGDVNEVTDKPLDISGINGGINYVENLKAIEAFGRICRHVEFKGITDPEELYAYAIDFAGSTVSEAITLELTAVELRKLGIVNAYDYGLYKTGNSYKVESIPHGIDEFFLCSKKSTNLFYPDKNKVTFGHTRKNLTDYI